VCVCVYAVCVCVRVHVFVYTRRVCMCMCVHACVCAMRVRRRGAACWGTTALHCVGPGAHRFLDQNCTNHVKTKCTLLP
jgi:hypothetical protein